MAWKWMGIALVLACVGLTGCGVKQSAPAAGEETTLVASLDDYGSDPAQAALNLDDYGDDAFSLDDYDDETQAQTYSDPFEGWNRVWFRFNDVALIQIMKPLHQGYKAVTPSRLRSGVSNFAYNLRAPIRFVNFLLQGELRQAGVEFGRFFANTVTSLGFADVAQKDRPRGPYTPENANFGTTLARWGVPAGPYLVWPMLGPTTARGTVGMVGDAFASPTSYAVSWPVSMGSSAYFSFNDLERVITAYETMNRMALEPYAAVRSGYFSLLHRQELALSLQEPWFSGLFGD